MAITASEACRPLRQLIEQVNDDRSSAGEIISKRGHTVLMSADDGLTSGDRFGARGR